jgi:Arc/MetJ-type ribon-helix-helix transcriptional regulator
MSSVRIHDQFEQPIEALVPSKYPSKSAVVFEALRQFFEKGDEPDLVDRLMRESRFISLERVGPEHYFAERGGIWSTSFFGGVPVTMWSVLGLVYLPADDEDLRSLGSLSWVGLGGSCNLINEGTPLGWLTPAGLEGQISYSLTKRMMHGSPPMVLAYPNALKVEGRPGQPAPRGTFHLHVRRRLPEEQQLGLLPSTPGVPVMPGADDPYLPYGPQTGILSR